MTGAEFELPGPLVLERGDVATITGKRALYYALADAIGVDNPPPFVPPGLVACPTCGTEQAPRAEGGTLGVHYPTITEQRPCAGSWPARPTKGRAA